MSKLNGLSRHDKLPANLVDLLHHRAQTQPDQQVYTFLTGQDGGKLRLTYGGLDRKACAIAAMLQEMGMAGERALLLYPPGLDYIAGFFGCLYAGVIAVPAYPPDPTQLNRMLPRLQAIVMDSQAKIALTTHEILPLVKGLQVKTYVSKTLTQNTFLRSLVDRFAPGAGEALDQSAEMNNLASLHWIATDRLDDTLAETWRTPQVTADTLAFLQYTSGSTGTPKGVMVGHGNLLHNTAMIQEGCHFTPDSEGVSWLPMYHDMGLIGGVLQPLCYGFHCTLMSPLDFLKWPRRWLQVISDIKDRPVLSGGPNFAYELCVHKITESKREGLALSNWCVAFTGAEPVRAETLDRFAESFAPSGFRRTAFYPCYGLAEATLFVAGGIPTALPVIQTIDKKTLENHWVNMVAPTDSNAQQLVGCGKGLLDQQIVIVNPETLIRCADKQVGEIWVASPSVTRGYWNRPLETTATFQAYIADSNAGPFLRTGDLGYLHDGELFVTGRLKDLIIIRGRNHYPQDIEQTAERSHSALRPGSNAAFAIDVAGEERLIIVQEVRPRNDLELAEVAAAIRQAVTETHALRVYTVVLVKPRTILKTSSGKIQRRACRTAFLQGDLEILHQWQDVITPERQLPDMAMIDAALPVDTAPAATTSTATHVPRPAAAATMAWLTTRIAELLRLDPAQIDVTQPFATFGLDSVQTVSLIGDLERWLGCTLAPTLAWAYPTIEALAHYLATEDATPVSRVSEPVAMGQAQAEPIAIVGLSCRFPGAANPDAFWQLLHNGVDAITEVPAARWDVERFYAVEAGAPGKMNSRWGGFLDQVDQFDAGFFGISAKEAVRMDPQQRVLLEVAWEALEQAGQTLEKLAGSQTGVFIGMSTNDYSRLSAQRPDAVDAYSGTGNAFSIAANRISYLFDLRGPSLAIDTACSSSLVALHCACQSLRSGESTIALAGGVNLILTPDLTVTFSQARMMAADGRCKAFDGQADGYVRGEGCGVVVLKRLTDALHDGDPILAVVRGSAINQDGRSNGLTAPNGQAQQAVIRQALNAASVTPAQISYVETHGTGTPLGDPIEVQALTTVLREGRTLDQPCLFGSAKTNIGHLEAAAGIAGLIKAVLALQHEEIPPHLHLQQINPLITLEQTPFTIATERHAFPRGEKPRLVGVSSFGFGGTNAHVVLEEAPVAPRVQPEVERPQHLLTLSAKTEKALQQLAERYANQLHVNPPASLGDFCFTANTRRNHFTQRLAIPATSSQQAAEALAAFSTGQDASDIIQGYGNKPSKVAFLFTGQGAQYVGMGRQLYATQPTFRAALDRCNELLDDMLGESLLEILYPPEHTQHTAGSSGVNGSQSNGVHYVMRQPQADTCLDQTAYTQPALFALEYALAELWKSWGVTPAAVMGHSVGEYAAACVAGVFSLEDGLKLVAARGRLMQALAEEGAMVALTADEAQVAAALQPYATAVSIAAVNGPDNVVISGARPAVQAVCMTLETVGVRTTWLKVSHAFHSPLMEPMLAAFEEVAATITYRQPTIPLISNVTGQPIGAAIATPTYWRHHVRQPVRFAEGMATLHNQGYNCFIEIGPKPTLLGMGRRSLPSDVGLWLPSLRLGQSDWQSLLSSLGELYVRGVPVDWAGFDRDYPRYRVALPTYPFQRARYWLDTAQTPGRLQHMATHQQAYGQPHPLLGRRLHLAGATDLRFEAELSPTTPAYLAHHCLFGQTILPATAYLEMALAAGSKALKRDDVVVEAVTIQRALLLPADTVQTVQVVLQAIADTANAAYTFQIFSLAQTADEAEPTWQLHAAGKVHAGAQEHEMIQMDLADLQAACPEPIAITAYYQQLQTRGLDYGAAFQAIAQLWCGIDRAIGEIHLPAVLELAEAPAMSAHKLHPALLDACFQLVGAALPAELQQHAYVPVGIEQLQIYGQPGNRLWSTVQIRPVSAPNQANVTADLQLFTPAGTVVAQVTGLQLKRVTAPLLPNAQTTFSDWLYTVAWQPQAHAQPTTLSEQRGSWLIFADNQGVGQQLAALLEKNHQVCTLVFPGKTYEAVAPQEYRIDPTAPDDFTRLVDDIRSDHTSPHQELPFQGVIHLWSLNDRQASNPQAMLELSCGSALHLVQALVKTGAGASPRLWFVTRGAQPVGVEPLVPAPFQSPLWGLGKVIALEHPELRCGRVDLDPHSRPDEVQALVNELGADSREDQIAFRNQTRLVARLAPGRLGRRAATPNQLALPQNQPFRLAIPTRGTLENLQLQPLERRPPQAGEVEIRVRATGLNFRDVLNTLDLYPGDAGLLGGECAGEIVAVGPGIADFALGAKVIAVAPGSFSQYVTVDAALVAPMPEALSFAEAATIPIVFLTAYYTLHHLAKLSPGDRVLIHAAAGGVGQAAIQLAQQVGAEIFATASPGKWELLKELGVKQIMNSRTTAFAAEIMTLTQGRGVDVILNSLSGGDFIAKSLSVLSEQGCFLEIGKRGVWDADQVAQVKPDASYFLVDLAQLCQEEPALIQRMLRALMQQFADGKLKPLPHKDFPIQDAVNAFRYMQQAKHFGKIIVVQPETTAGSGEPQPIPMRADGTYLITGGLGALGLLTARWLVGQGACHLVLMGRSGAKPAVSAQLTELEQMGAQVVIAQADISSANDVSRVLADMEATMPPLRGIIHAAGVLDDGILLQQRWDRFVRVMAPKVEGAWHLHVLTKHKSLDFFVMFSSAASLLGSPGQANYAAANAFLDALAHHRQAQGAVAMSINWGPWTDGGMAAQKGTDATLRARGITAITPQQGLAVMQQLFAQPAMQVGVMPIDWPLFTRQLPAGANLPFLTELPRALTQSAQNQQVSAEPSALLQQVQTLAPVERLQRLERYFQSEVAKVLGLDAVQLNVQQPINMLGLDSLMAVELRNRVKSELAVDIPMVKFIEGVTVTTLAALVNEQVPVSQPVASATLITADIEQKKRNSVKPKAASGLHLNYGDHRNAHQDPVYLDRAEDLLAKLDEMSDEEVDTLLNSLLSAPLSGGAWEPIEGKTDMRPPKNSSKPPMQPLKSSSETGMER